jgi:hypothetical protein
MGYRLASREKKRGVDARAIRMMGWLALAAGIVGKTIIQNKLVAVDFDMSTSLLGLAFYCLETIAIPVFSYLLVEGILHTKRFAYYFARVAGVAALSVIPYNLAYTGNPLNFSTQNPVIGLLVAMAMVYFFRQYGGRNLKGVAISVVVVLVSMMWVKMLNVQDGIATVLLVTTYWFCRKKQVVQVYGGAVVMVLCSVLNPNNPFTSQTVAFWNPFYIVGALGCLIMHFYNGDPDEGNRWVNYLAYPVMLLGIWAFAEFAM